MVNKTKMNVIFLINIFDLIGVIKMQNRYLKVFMVLIVLLSVASLTLAQSAQEWIDKEYNTTDSELKVEYNTKAIEMAPDFVEAYNNREHTYNKLGRYKEALVDTNKSIELDPRIEKPATTGDMLIISSVTQKKPSLILRRRVKWEVKLLVKTTTR